MPLFDSILNLFRRKPEDIPLQTPSDIILAPMAASTINSITLSPDMDTIYLIDNGRAIPFPLNTKLGVVIGTLDGQLTVATALPDVVITPTENESPDTPGGNETIASPAERVFRRPIPRALRLSTQTYHWNFLFVKEKAILSIIGATDIDASIIGATDIDASIIGATDIDASFAGPTRTVAERELIGATDIDASINARSVAKSATCRVFSFALAENSIRVRKIGDVLYFYL